MAVTDSNQTNDSNKKIDSSKIVDSRADNFEDLLPEAEPGLDEYVIRPVGTSLESFLFSNGQVNSLSKDKSKFKSKAGTPGGPANAYLDSKERERLSKEPLSEDQLIQRIKSMPDSMLPKFVKENAQLIVKDFKINTRKKVANFLGQVASESLRGVAEYVYYRSAQDLKKTFGGRVSQNDESEFVYDKKYLTSGTGYGFKSKTPWDTDGWPDAYYGSRSGPRNGNQYKRISEAQNGTANVQKGKSPDDFYNDPGFYKGSPDGYAYRGHGIIQLTGKNQYIQMNKVFGKGGKHEDSEVVSKGYDFVKNPELVSYNWKNPSNPNKYALLSSLMWWENHAGVQIDEVSLPTTKSITGAVRGSTEQYQERHDVVLKYYDWLLLGKSPEAFTGIGILKSQGKSWIKQNFGTFNYAPTGGDNITITGNWVSENIATFRIPQLNRIQTPLGVNGINRRFHKKIGHQVVGFFNEVEQRGLLKYVLTYDGDFYPRFIRATTGRIPRPVSLHSWGIAFDINARWNGYGSSPARQGTTGSVYELVPIATKWGFSWGGTWGRPYTDGMHFEISRII